MSPQAIPERHKRRRGGYRIWKEGSFFDLEGGIEFDNSKTLVGIAGVHFVVAELSRRGWIALPTIRNTAGIDILAHKGDRSNQIQVKTRENARRWVLGKSAEQLLSEDLFYVFVNLKQHESPEYFIFPSSIVSSYVTRTHRLFLEAGGKDNPMRAFPNAYGKIDLDRHESNWEILEQAQKEQKE